MTKIKYNPLLKKGFQYEYGNTSLVEESTDRNYITDEDKTKLSNLSGTNTGDQDLSDLLDSSHLTDFDHLDISHANRTALDLVSGENTGDQDLSNYIDKTTAQSISSVKTFTASPIVPTPVTDNEAVNKAYVDNATPTIPTIYEKLIWHSTLNVVTDDLLALDLNDNDIIRVKQSGDISEFEIDAHLGSYPNYVAGVSGCKINLTVNGLDVFTTDVLLVEGMNTINTGLQNVAVVKNDIVKIAVITGTGANDTLVSQCWLTIT